MAKKLVAMFVMCMIVAAAMQLPIVDAKVSPDVYKNCFTGCKKECMDGGRSSSDCEMKCDQDCALKEAETNMGLEVSH
ncbi:major pollen allergen Ole e 6-like [Mercurialis annua]|uniref:major pollen allergen Ole e 6-like n=1 Tax=Mercurialis annua TaxID=3986 RepID=UPI0021608325|nr:major pollen allergen Ole e 6-like [Mercurialis annua]